MPKCTGIATRLDDVWDAATKASVEHAFAGKRSFAPEMFQAATAALDAYAAEWTAAATDNCEATRWRASGGCHGHAHTPASTIGSPNSVR